MSHIEQDYKRMDTMGQNGSGLVESSELAYVLVEPGEPIAELMDDVVSRDADSPKEGYLSSIAKAQIKDGKFVLESSDKISEKGGRITIGKLATLWASQENASLLRVDGDLSEIDAKKRKSYASKVIKSGGMVLVIGLRSGGLDNLKRRRELRKADYETNS